MQFLKGQIDARLLRGCEQRIPMLLRDSAARTAAVAVVGPAVDAGHVNPGDFRDFPGAAEAIYYGFRNAHSKILRLSQQQVKGFVAIIAMEQETRLSQSPAMALGAKEIQRWLDETGVKQAALARAIELTPDKFTKSMKGERRFQADELERISLAMVSLRPGQMLMAKRPDQLKPRHTKNVTPVDLGSQPVTVEATHVTIAASRAPGGEAAILIHDGAKVVATIEIPWDEAYGLAEQSRNLPVRPTSE